MDLQRGIRIVIHMWIHVNFTSKSDAKPQRINTGNVFEAQILNLRSIGAQAYHPPNLPLSLPVLSGHYLDIIWMLF